MGVLSSRVSPRSEAFGANVQAHLGQMAPVLEAARLAMADPELRPRLAQLGLEPATQGPAAFAAFLPAHRARMGELIRQENIRLDG